MRRSYNHAEAVTATPCSSLARARELMDRWFQAESLRVRPAKELGSTETMKEIVAEGLGFAAHGRARRRTRTDLRGKPLVLRLSRTLAMARRGDKPLHRCLAQVYAALLGQRARRVAGRASK